ncbi:DUF2231 domain-containing protein [Saccharopolyspora rosea]|uniref:DUF2231 domain-containing protein n=1 Tax=Saccharopolyspora rosea TaxID=524884 RepID=A0ABW3G2F4_9PSEU|nr:DUF2231 domain-containing protein [Saccharopolyspora rosea]
MPAFVFGLPSHVLVVHAVVVLVPLAVLGALVVALWPAARRRFGWLVVGITAVATACIPLATNSGEQLRDRLATTDLIRQHAHLGDELLVYVAALLVLVAALVAVDQRRRNRATGDLAPKVAVGALAVLAVALAAVSAVQVVRIGDSGARAAWADKQYTAPHPEHRPTG